MQMLFALVAFETAKGKTMFVTLLEIILIIISVWFLFGLLHSFKKGKRSLFDIIFEAIGYVVWIPLSLILIVLYTVYILPLVVILTLVLIVIFFTGSLLYGLLTIDANNFRSGVSYLYEEIVEPAITHLRNVYHLVLTLPFILAVIGVGIVLALEFFPIVPVHLFFR